MHHLIDLTTKYRLFSGVLILVLILSGCGKDSGSDDSTYIPSPGANNPVANNQSDNNGTDGPDQPRPPSGQVPGPEDDPGDEIQLPGDEPCDNCRANEICLNDDCLLDSCKAAEDLGELDISSPITLTGNNSLLSNTIKASCASNENAPGKEKVYRFRTPSSVRMHLNISSSDSVDWLAEIRQSECHDPGFPDSIVNGLNGQTNDNIVGCYRHQDVDHIVQLDADTDYYLVVKPAYDGVGDFRVTMSFQTPVCEPAARQCPTASSSTIEACSPTGMNLGSYQCATTCAKTGCASGDCCLGNSCDAPLDIGFSDEQTVFIFTGQPLAYTNTINFDRMQLGASCLSGMKETRGTDLVVRINNLIAGETITIDALNHDNANNDRPTNSAFNQIYILGQCPYAQTESAECFATAVSGDGRLEWTAPRDGTFYVVFDRSELVSQSQFVYRLCKDDCPPYSSQ